jgi:hypothetical protein
MGPRERSDSGTFVETVSLEDVLGVFDAVRGPVITSSDVADQLDCTTESARQKLRRLYDRGEVDKRKTGRVVVWWHTGGTPPTPAERTTADADQSPTNPDAVDGEVRGSVDTSLADDDDLPAEDDGEEDVDPIADALAGWSYGRTDEEQAANDTVARASLEWLRETADAVRQSDVPLDDMAEVDPEDRKKDTLWRTVIRGAWQHADGQGYVERPDSRAYKWAGPSVDDAEDSGVYDPTEEFQ